MCGIAGIVRFDGLRPGEQRLGAAMAATLRHRGPDDAGAYVDALASLGHTRLSIIDPAGGRQPIGNEDGSVQVVFNGEIYNHASLAAELRDKGHRLRTHCDTEVIVHLYEELSDAFVDRLNGMFAIAVWDARRRRLVLVRDRLGIKPLYWSWDGERALFGSELKAVLAAGDLDRRVDPRALVDYLTFGHVSAPHAIFEGLRKLEPGCLAVCSASGVAVRRYWDVPMCDDETADERRWTRMDSEPQRHKENKHDLRPSASICGSYGEAWIDAFAELFDDAVALRKVADVPVGAFLSGGVDSASIVSAMRRAGGGAVLTHTVGLDDGDHDEREAARAVAGALGTDHHETLIRPDSVSMARRLAGYFDEPFADPAAVPTFCLSEAARRDVKVALAGDGADELLAGYRRYRFDLAESAVRARWPGWLREPAAGVAGWLYPKGDWLPRALRAKATLQNLSVDAATAHLRSVSIRAGGLPMTLLRPEVLADAGGYDPFDRGRELMARCPSAHPLNRVLYADLKTLLPDDMLTKVDRTSMAVGLEVRVPFLDHRLVELAGRMPVRMKLRAGVGKYVLREMLTRRMGARVAHRRKKGFDVPLDAWFRGPLREMRREVIEGDDAAISAWIAPADVRRIAREHDRGLRSNGRVLWALLTLELWARAFTKGESRTVGTELAGCAS